MKAIILTTYGGPEVLKLHEISKPFPAENEILIKIKAVSINFGDIVVRKMRYITPSRFHMPAIFLFIGKIGFGVRKPRIKILGSEFSGIIESVGSRVNLFKPGDEVFGYRGPKMGANAEYLCMRENEIVTKKPLNASFADAAAIPYGAIMALTILRKVKIEKGQKVLINGASGGIGPYALQIAKYFGAEVTAVCSSKSFEMMKALGVSKLIDYKEEDFTKNGEKYNLIFDILGKCSYKDCKKSLTEKGNLLYVSFKMKQVYQMLWTSLTNKKKVLCALSNEKLEDLEFIRGLIETGEIKAVLDKCFLLDQAAEAHSYIESGLKKGSVVLITE